ncbi:MAG: ABC-F family ATP-binding cassette domain-containing protein [Lachnospiraceae bacterium]|nr:ABC-F family ATP-binding cassette domain-containing protein [Lachnospiraceae bacterium]
MLLACNNITKSFGDVTILNQVSFHINEREKMAIVGINGAGKSTLLKVIMQELSADSGEVVTAKGATIGYLSQHQDLASDRTVYEEMLSVKADLLWTESRIREVELLMKGKEGDALDALLKEYTSLTHSFEAQNGYAYKSEVVGVLKGLGFSEEDFTKQIQTLSGGQKTRIALGRLLLTNPDLIMLDEPTNHLDMVSIAWLETYLINYPGAVLIVAHDRYFLDRVVTKVVELDAGKAQTFTGNYSDYAVKKEQQREILIQHYLNQQKEIKHQEEVIAKLRSFNREKSIKRAESREKMLDKIERIDKPTEVRSKMKVRLTPHIMSGNDVLTVTGLSKSFGNQKLFSNLNFEIKRGEKVAIIGKNGTGKTTILKIINDLLPADSGEIRPGAKVQIAYYDQEHQVLHSEKTLFDELQDTYPYMDNTEVRNVLAAFLFTGDDVFKRISEISGGERGRVSLAKLMLSDANLLILDEPTNHLDIVSKEILEDAINAYEGTVLYVSHDRYFINKTATRILDLTEQTLLNYPGNYDYYLEKKEATERLYLEGIGYGVSGSTTGTGRVNVTGFSGAVGVSSGQGSSGNAGVASAGLGGATGPGAVTETKLDWQQQKEEQARQRKRQNDLKKTEEEIERVETRMSELDTALADPAIASDHTKLTELSKEREELEGKLETLMEQWEELAE